jgi:hypothetical protein
MLRKEGETIETCVIAVAALYDQHMERNFAWVTYSGLAKTRSCYQMHFIEEFWQHFASEKDVILSTMKAAYDDTHKLKPYVDDRAEANIYSPFHLVIVQSLVSDYLVFSSFGKTNY